LFRRACLSAAALPGQNQDLKRLKGVAEMTEFDTICKVADQLAKDYPIKRLSYFGSYADGTQTEESDIDFLVEFTTPTISLIKLSGLKNRLEERLGLSVDLIHAPIPLESYIKINKEVLVYERP
jgi:predicted nucleotidyltransferase